MINTFIAPYTHKKKKKKTIPNNTAHNCPGYSADGCCKESGYDMGKVGRGYRLISIYTFLNQIFVHCLYTNKDTVCMLWEFPSLSSSQNVGS